MSESRIRIVLADDHPIVLKGLQQLLDEEPDFEVIAACRDGQEALDVLRTRDIDILVLDLRMPKLDGIQLLGQMEALEKKPRVVILTGNLSGDDLVEAMRLGARGFILKEMAPSLLVDCIRTVNAGGQWIEKQSAGEALDSVLRREQERRKIQELLTPREIEVMKLASGGLSNKEIAQQLFVGEGTIKTHLHSIYSKLNIENRMQLLILAKDRGIG